MLVRGIDTVLHRASYTGLVCEFCDETTCDNWLKAYFNVVIKTQNALQNGVV